ncbi:hypothetical protein T439DRAFT_320366 [Meredithblackwellia eburnea MCA 4105]
MVSPTNVHISTSTAGFTAVFGSGIDSIVDSFYPLAPAPIHPYHVTLLTKEEARSLQAANIPSPFTQQFSLHDIVPVGLGKTHGGVFIVVLFPSAALARKKAQLPPKDFHITISTPDAISSNDLPHDLSTLVQDPLSASPSPRLLDALSLHHITTENFHEAIYTSQIAIAQDPTSFKPFVRLGDACRRLSHHKSSMLAYGQAFDLANENAQVRQVSLERILELSQVCEWGATMTGSDKSEFESDVPTIASRSALLRPWSKELRRSILGHIEDITGLTSSLCVASRVPVFTPHAATSTLSHSTAPTYHHMQRFFRWIVPFHLAVSSEPRDELDIDALASEGLGIRHIVTLTRERRLPNSWFRHKTISNSYIPIVDFGAPSNEQIEAVLRLASNPDTTPLLVHCAGGKGRAGTMIAAYLACFGFHRPEASDPWQYPAMGWEQATSTLRAIRPGSVESRAQEEALEAFLAHVRKRGSPLPPTLDEPTDPRYEMEGKMPKSIDLLILVGLPGSGKSWFRKALLARDPTWSDVSGDDDGGTQAVLLAASHHRRGKLLIDRVNPTPAHRKELLALSQHSEHPVAIFFDAPAKLCQDRAQRRMNHPTLPPGGRVRAAIEQFEKSMSCPELKEGFDAVITVRSFPASFALVLRIAAPVTLFKFPRTSHLINLGAITDDDITRPLADFSAALRSDQITVITEKVDGANLAFSLDSNRRILIQNRSHYINTGTHVQFKKLGAWVERHREELDSLLGSDETFLERFCLFGEWMAAVHSVEYTKLPDLFLAFDLYDRAERKFVSRRDMELRLSSTTIHLTPLIHVGVLPSEAELVRLVQRTSNFTEGRVEGIYVKVENADWVEERGKVVRSDFISGNEHWSKGIISFNRLAIPPGA